MNSIDFKNLNHIKKQVYRFAETFDTACVCDSREINAAMNENTYELIAGIGLKHQLPHSKNLLFQTIEESKHYIFGNINYQSMSVDSVQHFLFEPQIVLWIKRNSNTLQCINNGINDLEFQRFIENFRELENTPQTSSVITKPDFIPQTTYENYLKMVEKIKQDIVQGVYYEMNYCMAFQAKYDKTSLLDIHTKLIENSAAPFAAYFKNSEFVLTCNSPERFIKRTGENLLTQPIKGTNHRSLEANEIQIEKLANSEKDKAENVMIVDLSRNDLAKVCRTGTIKVSELFGVYTFKSLNHLISSVEGKLKEGTSIGEIFEALFPMGSMTGAPKIEVMKHIELYEDVERGIYSGCMGYITPNKDFDFNVIIRSLELDPEKQIISYKVGGAITFDSSAEEEYQECLLKAKNILAVF
jgi:para-aminobenzoate synthetase component I